MAELGKITIKVNVEEGEHDPEIIGVFSYHDKEYSKYPDRIRISFIDGHTEIYDIRRIQPHPIIMENIKIIKKWKQGYVNQPARRKKK